MTAAIEAPGCPQTTSNTTLGAELEMYPLKTNRGVWKLEWGDMTRKTLPVMVDQRKGGSGTREGQDMVRWSTPERREEQDGTKTR